MAGLLASMLKWSRTDAASLAALGPEDTCGWQISLLADALSRINYHPCV